MTNLAMSLLDYQFMFLYFLPIVVLFCSNKKTNSEKRLQKDKNIKKQKLRIMEKDINLWKKIKGKTRFFQKHAYQEEHDIELNIRISFVHFISQRK